MSLVGTFLDHSTFCIFLFTAFYGTGTQVFDRGVTEAVTGFSYRLKPHLLRQVYGVENVDFIIGSAADWTRSTLRAYHFRS